MALVASQSGAVSWSITLNGRDPCRLSKAATGNERSALLVSKTPTPLLQSRLQGKQLSSRHSAPSHGPSMVLAAPSPTTLSPEQADPPSPSSAGFDSGAQPPFSLADIRHAIPKHCFRKDTLRSLSFVAKDVLVVFGLAIAAATVNHWAVWPLYWLAQGTMFWALFVIGHDCGHGSFSNSKLLNDFIGHLVHSSILIPYHGWRISHRTHHQNTSHVENDESWHPVTESFAAKMDRIDHLRWAFPWILVAAFPYYLLRGTPGKKGSHLDPSCHLFAPSDRNDILTSNAYLLGFATILTALGATLGPAMLVKLYVAPYIVNLVWLTVVTYLHHHGEEKVPWYRGKEWSYLRGALSSIDRDYGIFEGIHHDMGTHVVHHLFPQLPHYHLKEATKAMKPVLGEYYREPEKCKGPIPTHLGKPLVESFANDHVVADQGEVVYYKKAAWR